MSNDGKSDFSPAALSSFHLIFNADHRSISAAWIQLGKAHNTHHQNIGMSLSVGMMVTLDARRPSINGGEFIEITLQFGAREAFDVTDQVTVLWLKALRARAQISGSSGLPFYPLAKSGSQASSCENPTFHSIAAPENASAAPQ